MVSFWKYFKNVYLIDFFFDFLAQRLGKINVKVALVKVLTNYDVQAIKKEEIEFDNFAVTIVPKGGINLKLRKKIK